MQALTRSLVIAVAALLLSTCKPDSNTVVNVQPAEEAASLAAQGWARFGARDYPAAIGLFRLATEKDDLYADAYNGMAWSYARLDSLNRSRQYFDIAIGLQFTMIDAFAGRSFVSLAQGNYRDAVEAVAHVQSVGPPFYTLRHDPNISLSDLLLVKAQSYFFLQEYAAAQQIINVLDPGNGLDPASPNYIEDLALEIEYLWSII